MHSRTDKSILDIITELNLKHIKISVTKDNNIEVLDPKNNLNEELVNDLKGRKQEFINWLNKYINSNNFNEIPKAEDKEFYSLSSAQTRLFFLQNMSIHSTVYNMPQLVKFIEKPDVEEVENAFRKLIARHEILRTSFFQVNGAPVQKIHSHINNSIEFVEVNNKKEFDACTNGIIEPFDLSKAPLIRAKIISIVESNQYYIFIDKHHIISDGLSNRLLENDFTRIFSGQQLLPVKLQYKDYAEWQMKYKKSSGYVNQEKFWLENLAKDIKPLELPYDYERPKVKKFDGDILTIEIDKELAQKIFLLSKETDSTFFMIFLSALNILLYKYSGTDDIIVGTPISGRTHVDLKNIFGLFVNMVVFRNEISPKMEFIEFLAKVKNNSIKVFENQDYQFNELIQKLGITVENNRNPLFDIAMHTFNIGEERIVADKSNFQKLDLSSNVSRFDMLFGIIHNNERFVVNLEYSTELFKKETINIFIERYIDIIKQVCENKVIPIKDISFTNQFEIIEENLSNEFFDEFEF